MSDPPADRAPTKKASRTQQPFPAVAFEDAAVLAQEIQRLGGGQSRIRRLTLFEQLKRSPDSGLARQQIVNSNRYGLTKGSYKAEFLELTPLGKVATNPDAPARERTRARFDLAIAGIEPFRALYEGLQGNKLPAQQVMRDQLTSDLGLSDELAKEAVELFIVNAKFSGLLRPVAGSERVLSIEHVLDEQPAVAHSTRAANGTPVTPVALAAGAPGGFSSTCFYVTPIGDESSPERKHADVLRLVVADLSFHNPNVFYELAIRHATGKPTVLLCRTEDGIPFDIADVRTIRVDMTDIHAFVTQMETWRAELTSMARRALEEPGAGSNPLTAFAGEFQALATA